MTNMKKKSRLVPNFEITKIIITARRHQREMKSYFQ